MKQSTFTRTCILFFLSVRQGSIYILTPLCISCRFRHDKVLIDRHGTRTGVIDKLYIVGIEDREYFYRPMWRMEIVFTIFYDLEVLFKVCLLQRQSTNDMKKIKSPGGFLIVNIH